MHFCMDEVRALMLAWPILAVLIIMPALRMRIIFTRTAERVRHFYFFLRWKWVERKARIAFVKHNHCTSCRQYIHHPYCEHRAIMKESPYFQATSPVVCTCEYHHQTDHLLEQANNAKTYRSTT